MARLQRQQAAEQARAAEAAAASRALLERTLAERSRAALATLRADAERDARNADRKLRELATRVRPHPHVAGYTALGLL